MKTSFRRITTMAFICVIMAFLGINCAYAAITIDMVKIARIESSYNPKAFNPHSGAIGLCQITKPVLIEYNQRFNTNWTLKDLYNGDLNMLMGDWYMNTRIPQLLKHYKIKNTLLLRILCYNWGIGNVIKWNKKGAIYANIPKESKDYYKKYLQM